MNITGGKYNSIKIKTPSSDNVRPTLSKIRAGVFNSLNSIIDFEKSSFLDCFGGSGIISLEAISRGFKNVITIEKDFKTAQIIKENFASLKIKPNLIIKDSLKALQNIDINFDAIYLDPPYVMSDLYEKSLKIIEEKCLLKSDGIVILEIKKGKINFKIPPKFQIFKERTYGNTTVLFLKKI